jgi:spore photoproduct lyase
MSYKPFLPSKVYAEQAIVHHPNCQKILSKLPHIELQLFDNLSDFMHAFQKEGQFTAFPPTQLVLAHQKSSFLKKCPGTQRYICCGYQILNLVNNCEIGCSYCILQGYLNNPFIIVYVNSDAMFAELEEKLNANSEKVFRIGTGELADSLSTDHLTEYSKQLVTFFADKKNALIELKTKTIQIENFIHLDHQGRTVVAWSLNTPNLIAQEESWAPTLEQRLEAAEQCQRAGFKLAFHFDPMIYYDDWETGYSDVVKNLFERIDPQNITWISLGALRYPPQLDQVIRRNHPKTNIVYGELFPGIDGKLRYFKPIRIEMFQKMYGWIKSLAPNVFVYLCMESSEVWEKSFGWTPKSSAGLKKMMDELVVAE